MDDRSCHNTLNQETRATLRAAHAAAPASYDLMDDTAYERVAWHPPATAAHANAALYELADQGWTLSPVVGAAAPMYHLANLIKPQAEGVGSGCEARSAGYIDVHI